MRCEGSFERIANENERIEWDNRQDKEILNVSESPNTETSSGNNARFEDIKMEWIMGKIGEMSKELASKSDLIEMIRQMIREELENYKREMEEMIEKKLKGNSNKTGCDRGNYNEVVKDKRNENLVIVKSRREQDSNVTKKIVQEKVDIKNLAVDITKKETRGLVYIYTKYWDT